MNTDAETTSREVPSHPMPPARTRWIEPREAGTRETALLGPVRSTEPPARLSALRQWLPEAPATAAPSAPAEKPSLADEEDAAPWAVAAASRALDAPDLADPFAPEPLAPDEDGAEPLLLLDEEPIDEFTAGSPAHVPTHEMQPVQAPLSPWELTGESSGAGQLTDDVRGARGRREWEAFGEAIMAALGIDENTSLETAMRAMADRLEQPEATEPPVPAEIVDLADRIASFAFRLRAHGYAVVVDAQAAGDRLDSSLGGLAASYLTGHGT
ncbi:MAG: hypothetical protein L0271_05310 [Gemmatimonadetes bacterium]|nr:hypothetical protein [Gemmatimonadota bacterium]